jgi:small subunit ribosomal protein S13
MFLQFEQSKQSLSLVAALMRVYGVNQTYAKLIISKMGLFADVKVVNVPEQILRRANVFLMSLVPIMEQQLRHREQHVIEEHLKIGTYKGFRFSQGLPVNGQRTHSNGKTPKRLFRGKYFLGDPLVNLALIKAGKKEGKSGLRKRRFRVKEKKKSKKNK